MERLLSIVGRVEMALQLFSGLELQHGLAIGLPEFTHLGFILLGDFLGIKRFSDLDLLIKGYAGQPA